jgi:hypothetical protein
MTGLTGNTLVTKYVELKNEGTGEWLAAQVNNYNAATKYHVVTYLYGNSRGGEVDRFADLSPENFRKTWRIKKGKQAPEKPPAAGEKRVAAPEPETEQCKKFKKVMDESAAEFLCTITQELPIDPVTAEDGRVYERSAIEEWLERNEKSPHTNEPMGKRLFPALQVKNMIAAMVKSGALSGGKCAAWTQKLEQEKEVEKTRQAAEAGKPGSAHSMALLADWYRAGQKGLKKDLPIFFHWAKRAADLGNPRGNTQIAQAYLDGHGTAKNLHTGLIKLAEAAARGSEHACYVLAWIYHNGSYSVAKDASQVQYWVMKMRDARGSHHCDCSAEVRAEAEKWVAEA